MMYKHILIPVALDHEALVDKKLETCLHLLADDGKVTLLTVLENVPGFVSEFVTVKSENHVSAKVRERLEAIVDGKPNMSCDVITGKPGVEITRYAGANDVDLIMVGSHQPGIEDYFLGSTASRVARRSPCSVLIVR
ncbi:MAG: universal stress protein [Pseudomonadota bacterium]